MNADFESLRKYCDIKARLHTLTHLEVTDTVSGSSDCYPYTQHPVKLCGVACDDKTLQEVNLLRQELNALDGLVDNVSDIRAKNLLDMHYRKGLTWGQISRNTGRDSEAERQYLCRFFKKKN